MVNISITISGDKALISKFMKFKSVIEDWSGAVTTITDYMKMYYSQVVFETEGGVYGQRWADVSPAYDFYKRTHATKFGILQFTGTMQNSFKTSVQGNSGEVFNRDFKFPFHQKGTRRGIAARPMIKINDPIRMQFKSVLQKEMSAKIKRVF